MATTHQYLIFTINLNSLAQVQALQGTGSSVAGAGIGAILDVAPDDAALTPYNPTLKHYAAPRLARHAKFVAPSITSEWFDTPNQYPTNVGFFDRKSGGWFGWSWLFGDTTHYHWRGVFNYVAGDTTAAPAAVPVMQRRWLDGFELPLGGEGGAGTMIFSRGSSRHPDGMGLALKQVSAARSHTTIENLGGASPRSSWERFYVRIQVAPATQTPLWRAKSSISPAAGFAFYVLPTRQLALYEVDSVGTLNLVATIGTPLALNTWARLDIFVGMGQNGLGAGSLTLPGVRLWINGISALVFTQALTAGVQSNADRHTSSEIGGTLANTMSADVDDWFNAAIPQQLIADGLGIFEMDVRGVDWQAGTKIAMLYPTALAAATANWTGDVTALLKNPHPTALGGSTMTSVVAAAPLVSDTDWADAVSAQPNAIGLVTLLAVIKATTVTAAARLGFISAELTGAVNGVISVAVNNFYRWMVQVSGGTGGTALLKPSIPIQLEHLNGTGGLETVYGLYGIAEIAGTFGPEDAGYKSDAALSLDNLAIVAPKTLAPHFGPHNSAYPRSPWARQTTTPQQPVYVKGGTYVGNGTGQDLLFPVPINWIWIRPAAGAGVGSKWFTSMMGATKGVEQQIQADGMVRALQDPTFVPGALDTQQAQYRLRIAGADTQWNQNTVTYQYVAVGDPGMRFMCNGVLGTHRGTADYITALANGGFTPLAALLKAEGLGGGATAGMFYKGPGHAAASLSPLDVAELAAALTFGVGSMTSKSAFMGGNGYDGIPFNAWRTNDGGLTAGVSNNGQVVQLFSYTGDGSATRTINCTPASGKRPMFAMIVPHNDVARWRDPSHTGTTNGVVNTGALTATDEIKGGGIDSIAIGSLLNTAAVVYDVFVIPGDATAGNNGWGANVEIMPVSPDPPPLAPGDPSGNGPEPPNAPTAEAVVPVVVPDPLPPVGPMPTLTDDLDVACEPDTRRIINLALSRLGISKQIANVATEASREAVAVRLIYNDSIQQTLRDAPWPFATRLVQLAVLAAGVRPNSDWLYSYRQPNDCLFERRIVDRLRTDVANPQPIPFQLSSDDTGGLIWCNVASAVLEYTARPKCPHTRSEPLFKDAAAWKLAEALAPALSRMTDAVKMCATGYREAIQSYYDVLRPGNPGEVPAAATVDTTAAAKLANLTVVNLALIRIGARTVRDLSADQSREAQIARMIFEQELRATLRDFPWPFATAYATPAVVGGTATVPLNNDWQYSYRLPTDVVFIRRLVTTTGRAYDPKPPQFRTAIDATGGLLYTNEAAAVIEYTQRLEGAVDRSGPLFKDALAWKMAWTMAPSLAQIVPEKPEAIGRGADATELPTRERGATGIQLRQKAAETARACYYFAIATARTAAANESQPNIVPPDADWISGR